VVLSKTTFKIEKGFSNTSVFAMLYHINPKPYLIPLATCKSLNSHMVGHFCNWALKCSMEKPYTRYNVFFPWFDQQSFKLYTFVFTIVEINLQFDWGICELQIYSECLVNVLWFPLLKSGSIRYVSCIQDGKGQCWVDISFCKELPVLVFGLCLPRQGKGIVFRFII
jgi:hypothetical protein